MIETKFLGLGPWTRRSHTIVTSARSSLANHYHPVGRIKRFVLTQMANSLSKGIAPCVRCTRCSSARVLWLLEVCADLRGSRLA